jgi:hypothetical protein
MSRHFTQMNDVAQTSDFKVVLLQVCMHAWTSASHLSERFPHPNPQHRRCKQANMFFSTTISGVHMPDIANGYIGWQFGENKLYEVRLHALHCKRARYTVAMHLLTALDPLNTAHATSQGTHTQRNATPWHLYRIPDTWMWV